MSETENHIAIIGMACRFPGANNVNTYWKNLCEGTESISFFSEEEVQSRGVDAKLLQDPNYVRAGGVLESIEDFDAALFGFNPREAKLSEPQHRLLLECGWEALEHAGYNPRSYDGLIGVFAGSGIGRYLTHNLIPSFDWNDEESKEEARIENFFGYLATRLSYKLHLTGPSVTLQTACSTSLVATHMACQSLLNYECDMALAGGAYVHLPQYKGYWHEPDGILSPDGHCRTFDSNAAGTVFSSGGGIVVLKRLQDAIDDGDCIDAVILGSSINNDGDRKVGYSAPSAQGQSEVVAMAQAVADVKPADIRFVETHGTGTLLGDPIEVSGLKKAFNLSTKNHCALGSVKPNIGHTDAGAGVAGLIKAALAVKNGVIPPNINFENPNPALEIEKSPFYINKERLNWPDDQGSRIAGVSSFGMGGTNAHAIVKQPPELGPRKEMSGPSVIVLSAASEKSLHKAEINLEKFLQNSTRDNIKDIAYTLQVGRVPLAHRRAIVCQDKDDLLAKLRGDVTHDSVAGQIDESAKSVAFMFTGQGSQYANMGRDLYDNVEVFRTVFDQCAELLQSHLGQDLRTLLYVTPENEEEASKILGQTKITQPLLFAFEYALAKTWKAWGIEPTSFIGHSIGEYVAACLCGVMSLEDALLLVTERGRLIQSLPGGTMLAVSLPEEKITQFLSDDISLAAVNAPESCVLSGETPAMNKLAEELEKQDIAFGKLHTSHAFHSLMMDPILDSFRQRLEDIQLSKPSKPFISNVTGKWITDEEATSPDYWVRHIRQAVRFSDGIQCLADTHKGVLLEVGPGNTLCTLSRKNNQTKNLKILASVRHPHDLAGDEIFIYRTLSTLWTNGCDVKWKALPNAEQCRRVHLPTYAFDRKRYWVEPEVQKNNTKPQQTTGKQTDIDKWFYQLNWKRTPIIHSRPSPSKLKKTWVVFAYPSRIAETLKAELATHGDEVIVVLPGTEFKYEENQYTIDPSKSDHFDRLLTTIYKEPSHFQFVYALSLHTSSSQADINAVKDNCLNLLNLAQAIEDKEDVVNTGNDIVLNVLTSGAEDVLGSEEIDPDSALAAGVALVNGQEQPNCFTRHFDIPVEELSQADSGWTKILAKDLHSDIDARSIAYRNQQRWQPAFDSLDLSGRTATMLRDKGVYLITGGLGKIGLTIAQFLADKVSARLVLLLRSKFPPREEWDGIIAQSKDTSLVDRLQLIRDIEKKGSTVQVMSADVSNIDQMTEIVESIKKEYGALNGVIHSAGLIEEGAFKTIPDIRHQDFENQFRPKVKGVKVLKQALVNTDIDFCLLVSSLASQLGGLGSTVYSSSNRFMDAFARKMHREGHPWLSTNWDTWQFGALPIQSNDPASVEFSTYYLTPDEGMQALDKVFSVGDFMPVICISTGDLNSRYEQFVLRTQEPSLQIQTESAPHQEESSAQTEHQDSTENDSPRNEMEKALVEIWQSLLGLDHIGIKDNFFELGGDSLLGLRLTSRIRKQLNMKLSINELFKAPTIIELAPSLEEKNKKSENGSNGASQLQKKIDEMSPEEISALLEKKQQERNA